MMAKKEWINLDDAVVNALNLFCEKGVPSLYLGNYKRPLVIGSGNAAVTGRIIFEGKDAVFATDATYQKEVETKPVDGAVLITASGEKDAPKMAELLRNKKIETRLITCSKNSSASKFIEADKIFVIPTVPEVYTYDTCTYGGMILGKTKEDPKKILEQIQKNVSPILPNFKKYKAFYFLVPKEFYLTTEMFCTKFVQLFGRKFARDFYTPEYAIMHATDVVPTKDELFISIGYENTELGEPQNRLNIPVTKDAGYAEVMMIGFYIIGRIQRDMPGYFRKNIKHWCDKKNRPLIVKYE